jgi:hypothetical protein
MFIQVLEGRVHDLEGLRQQVETWMSELAPGADGYLGATAGVTADGTFVSVVRFESQEAAKANSDRPEQGAWWDQTKEKFDGDVSFTDCPEVDTFGGGGSDDARFVQIMSGRGDRSVMLPVAEELEEVLRRVRPDVIGGTVGWVGDGSFVQVVYFTSEGEARTGESAQPSPEDQAALERLSSSMEVDRFLDLSDPWLYSR